MERVHFGEKLTVSPVVIGTMNLLDWGVNARGLLDRVKEYIDLGLTTFDLADIYGGGGCEELFGRMLALEPSIRDKIEIISKGCIVYDTLRRPYFVSESYNLSKDYILSACNASLRRLGVDSLETGREPFPKKLTVGAVCGRFLALFSSRYVRRSVIGFLPLTALFFLPMGAFINLAAPLLMLILLFCTICTHSFL